MTSEYQAAMKELATNTIRVDATSNDVVKAIQTTNKPAAKGLFYHSKAIVCHTKAAIATHALFFAVAGGVVIGITAYHLVNKFWLNKDDTTEKSSSI